MRPRGTLRSPSAFAAPTRSGCSRPPPVATVPGRRADRRSRSRAARWIRQSRAAAVRWLLDDIRGPQKGHLTTGIFGTKFALDALSAEGHAQAVFDIVTQELVSRLGAHARERRDDAVGALGAEREHLLAQPPDVRVDQRVVLQVARRDPAGSRCGRFRSHPDQAAVGRRRRVGAEFLPIGARRDRLELVADEGTASSGRSPFPVNATATIFLPADRLEDIQEGQTTLVPAVARRGFAMRG